MLSKLKETRLLSGISVSTLYSHSLVLGSMQLELSLTVPRALYELECAEEIRWRVRGKGRPSTFSSSVRKKIELCICILGLDDWFAWIE